MTRWSAWLLKPKYCAGANYCVSLPGNGDLKLWEGINGSHARRYNWVSEIGLVAAQRLPLMSKVSSIRVAGDAGSSINGTQHALGTSYTTACSLWLDYIASRIGGQFS